MTNLREAAQQALEALMDAQRHNYALKHKETGDLITTLSAALAEPQSTHSADCYKWHHECAIARIEELKLLCEEMLSELYVYRASKHLKDAAAAIRTRGEK